MKYKLNLSEHVMSVIFPWPPFKDFIILQLKSINRAQRANRPHSLTAWSGLIQ